MEEIVQRAIENIASAGVLGAVVAVLLYYVIKSREQIDNKLLTMLDGKLDSLIKTQSEVLSTLKEISVKQDMMLNELKASKRRRKVEGETK